MLNKMHLLKAVRLFGKLDKLHYQEHISNILWAGVQTFNLLVICWCNHCFIVQEDWTDYLSLILGSSGQILYKSVAFKLDIILIRPVFYLGVQVIDQVYLMLINQWSDIFGDLHQFVHLIFIIDSIAQNGHSTLD